MVRHPAFVFPVPEKGDTVRLHLKTATVADATAVDELLTAHALAHTGKRPPTGVARAKLTTPATSSAIVTGTERRARGFAHVWRDDGIARFLIVVRPGTWGSPAIGEALLTFAERRAADLGVTTVKTHQCAEDAALGELLASRSYRVASRILQMRADLENRFDVVPSRMPDGVEIAAFDPDRDADRLFAVVREAFPDENDDEAAWWREHRDDPTRPYDPVLWLVARGGDGDIVGFALGSRRVEDDRVLGYLGGLGVSVADRGRGIGRALLAAMMDVFADAGFPAMSLSVAAGNRTGALSLYRSLGFSEVPESTEWVRELPG